MDVSFYSVRDSVLVRQLLEVNLIDLTGLAELQEELFHDLQSNLCFPNEIWIRSNVSNVKKLIVEVVDEGGGANFSLLCDVVSKAIRRGNLPELL